MQGAGADMQAILSAIQSVNLNVDRRFADFQVEFRDLRAEVSSMKLEMMTRPEFEKLETRVFDLESKVVSADNLDVRFLQEQLDRLDPAHKCISIVGFGGGDVGERTRILEDFLKEKLPSIAQRCNIEHVFKGKWNERKLAGVSILEFPSKTVRDEILKYLKTSNSFLNEGSKT